MTRPNPEPPNAEVDRLMGRRPAHWRRAIRSSNPGRPSQRPRPLLIVVLWLLWGSAAFAETAEEAYRRGMAAVDRGSWAEVAEAMSTAVRLRPSPGGDRVKIYGMRFERYTPYYFLGLARAELGECSAALAAFVEVDPELLGDERRSQLEVRRASCKSLLGARSSSRQEAVPEAGTEPTLAPQTPRRAALAPADPPAPPPPALRRAASDYLSGLYHEVLSGLESFVPRPSASVGTSLEVGEEDQAIALLLRGAAGFALAKLAGEEGPSGATAAAHLDSARQELRAYRLLRPQSRPSPYWFSPAFLAFFDGLELGSDPQNR